MAKVKKRKKEKESAQISIEDLQKLLELNSEQEMRSAIIRLILNRTPEHKRGWPDFAGAFKDEKLLRMVVELMQKKGFVLEPITDAVWPSLVLPWNSEYKKHMLIAILKFLSKNKCFKRKLNEKHLCLIGEATFRTKFGVAYVNQTKIKDWLSNEEQKEFKDLIKLCLV
jgi:hypothetical protein